MKRYQGEVTEKNQIHDSFRAKSKFALASREAVKSQDWAGLRAILEALLSAFAAPQD